MDVRLIDKHRNVTIAPKKGPPFTGAVLAVLDDLLARNPPQNGQSEFVADREFADALRTLSDEPETLRRADQPWRKGHEAFYRDIPIFVETA